MKSRQNTRLLLGSGCFCLVGLNLLLNLLRRFEFHQDGAKPVAKHLNFFLHLLNILMELPLPDFGPQRRDLFLGLCLSSVVLMRQSLRLHGGLMERASAGATTLCL